MNYNDKIQIESIKIDKGIKKNSYDDKRIYTYRYDEFNQLI